MYTVIAPSIQNHPKLEEYSEPSRLLVIIIATMSMFVNFNIIDRYSCKWCPADLVVYDWPNFEKHVESEHLNIRDKQQPAFPMIVTSGLLPAIVERRRSYYCKRCNEEFIFNADVKKNTRVLETHLKECDYAVLKTKTETEPAVFASTNKPRSAPAPKRSQLAKPKKDETARAHQDVIATTVMKAIENKRRLESFDSDATVKIETKDEANESADSDHDGGSETDESVGSDQSGFEQEEGEEEEPEPRPKIMKLERGAVVLKPATSKIASVVTTRRAIEVPRTFKTLRQFYRKVIPTRLPQSHLLRKGENPKAENATSSSAVPVIPTKAKGTDGPEIKKKYIAKIVARKSVP